MLNCESFHDSSGDSDRISTTIDPSTASRRLIVEVYIIPLSALEHAHFARSDKLSGPDRYRGRSMLHEQQLRLAELERRMHLLAMRFETMQVPYHPPSNSHYLPRMPDVSRTNPRQFREYVPYRGSPPYQAPYNGRDFASGNRRAPLVMQRSPGQGDTPGWRARYQVAPHFGRELSRRDQQTRYEIERYGRYIDQRRRQYDFGRGASREGGRWAPSSRGYRSWNDPLDFDPYNKKIRQSIGREMSRYFPERRDLRKSFNNWLSEWIPNIVPDFLRRR